MRAMVAYSRNDARNIRREPFLIYLVIVPWVMLLLARTAVPGLTRWLAGRFGFDLVQLYPLLICFFFIMEIPMIIGVVMGLVLLDERDDRTLLALQVTPISMTGYVIYRMALTVALSAVHILICTPLTGLISGFPWAHLVPIALLASLFAPLLALVMATFAGNKVEGLALMKAFGILMVGPVAAYFMRSDWQLFLGVLPTYWWAKAFWAAGGAGSMWPYLFAGTIYHALLITWLFRRFLSRVQW